MASTKNTELDQINHLYNEHTATNSASDKSCSRDWTRNGNNAYKSNYDGHGVVWEQALTIQNSNAHPVSIN